ncbi:OmpA family protein [Vandammella animalimorsus]|nr:OmpA family protein [Vandammella animalimorsus]
MPTTARNSARLSSGLRSGVCVLAVFSLAGCQTMSGGVFKDTFANDDPCAPNARNIGIAAGGLVGALVGRAVGDKETAAVVAGGVIGAAVGGLIGQDIDYRRCELSKISRQHQLAMAVQEISLPQAGQSSSSASGLLVSLQDAGQEFVSGSAQPTARGRQAFADIARAYKMSRPGENPQDYQVRIRNIRILLVGHTDDTGSTTLNAELSEKRARAVAEIFAQHGFQRSQLFFQGAGETLPIASNETEEGRRQNRRVEIIDLHGSAALDSYIQSRTPQTRYYRAHTEIVSPAESKPTSGAATVASAPAPKAAPPTRSAPPPKAPQQSKAPLPSKSPSQPKPQAPARATPPQETSAPVQTASGPSASSPQQPARQGSAIVRAAPGSFIDFGGSRLDRSNLKVANIGQAINQEPAIFSLISKAHASGGSAIAHCTNDRYREQRGVKSLQTGKLKTSEYMPGLYQTSWVGMVNGHLLAMNKMAVLRESALPANAPELLIYTDYKGDKKSKAQWRGQPKVNTYHGSNGLLYRIFSDGPIQCMDILIPNQRPTHADAVVLIYKRQGESWQSSFAMDMAGRKK